MASPNNEKTLVTARIPIALMDEVRLIAERESETQSLIIRRLLRLGLAAERRSVEAAGG